MARRLFPAVRLVNEPDTVAVALNEGFRDSVFVRDTSKVDDRLTLGNGSVGVAVTLCDVVSDAVSVTDSEKDVDTDCELEPLRVLSDDCENDGVMVEEDVRLTLEVSENDSL